MISTSRQAAFTEQNTFADHFAGGNHRQRLRRLVKRLYEESVKVLKDADIVAGIARDGGTTGGNTPQLFAREIRDEIAESARVIKAAKIWL